MISATLNKEHVISLQMHMTVRGAWSATVNVASDNQLSVGAAVELVLHEEIWVARVTRTEIFGERLLVQLTGGPYDWCEVREVKHYTATTAATVLKDLGIKTDKPATSRLDFWTRNPGTTGTALESLAQKLGVPWKVNPDGTVQLREPDAPQEIDKEAAMELNREPTRGLVNMAPETDAVRPGQTVNGDVIGDVIYEIGDTARLIYYTDPRGTWRESLHRIIRYITRDSIFLGQYSCLVVSQGADGSLDLQPDDIRIRAQGLQKIPIRHGLPGCKVEVIPGGRVLLAFDGGDPSKPYAALWHEGVVKSVKIGGTGAEVPVVLDDLLQAKFASIETALLLHIHTSATPASPTTPPVGLVFPPLPFASQFLFSR